MSFALAPKCYIEKYWLLLTTIYLFLLTVGCGPADNMHINFIGLAQGGQWINDANENLVFGGKDQDNKGFARYTSSQLEDGLKYDLLLETHPRWVNNGGIEGHFRMTIPNGVAFRAVVGFIEGAVTTDGVTFQVVWKKDPPAGNPPIAAVQGQIFKAYNHTLASFVVDLRGLAGQTGEFILKVNAGTSSGQDWAVWQTAQIAPFAEIDDVDKDGISDETELQLLQRYSPYYKFSQESINSSTVQEEYRPTDAIWYLRHCDLLYGGDQNSPVVFNKDQINADVGIVTNAQWKGSDQSNILSTAKKTSFRMNIYDQYRSGFLAGDGHDWPEICNNGNIGLYGHVVPTSDKNVLKVEYWQFFGFNQANAYNVDEHDHEADWCYVSVLYNVSGDSLLSVSYAHHGDQETRLLGRGHVDILETNGAFILYRELDNLVINVLVEMYQGAGELGHNHPVVYVEWGGHEFWPRPAGSETFAPNHDGTGQYRYLTHDVPNLGEVENPMNGSSGVIMQFNGRWGAWNSHNENPPGVELHTEWLWPAGSPIKNVVPPSDFEN